MKRLRELLEDAAGVAWALAFVVVVLAGLALIQVGVDPERVLFGRWT